VRSCAEELGGEDNRFVLFVISWFNFFFARTHNIARKKIRATAKSR
jgi:hypothetical protein